MAEMMGYSVAEIEGRSLLDFVFDEDRTEAERRLDLRRKGVREPVELRLAHRRGREIWVTASTVRSSTSDGHVTGSLAMCTDVTARRRADAERARLNSAVEQAAEAIMMTRRTGRSSTSTRPGSG